jgi:hypothetical protein
MALKSTKTTTSVVRIGTPPPPHTQASVYLPFGSWGGGGGGPPLCGKGSGGDQFGRGDIHSGTLFVYMYFVLIPYPFEMLTACIQEGLIFEPCGTCPRTATLSKNFIKSIEY